ncbi:hypothetical protein DMH02_004070 [Streptomyces sp. WAC 00631]|uniref:hypothetical protein n=1 Tax=Streptomyces sp. WAC 00631 TaxID=2203201 RepID=UPI00163C8FCF|nr:hypothetical protein [Streptomyces sp. WAC 00631]MCC5032447.1 hypothetical protein [Streptomyces sp. WAC 00631]
MAAPVFGELLLDDRVGVRVVRAAGRGEQLHDAPPLREFRFAAAVVVGPVLVATVHVRVEFGFPERLHRFGGRHAPCVAPDRGPADLRAIKRRPGAGAGLGDAAGAPPVGPGAPRAR